MLRILFVDDEANVLQGLRRVTRGMRDEWEMHFAESGEDALAHIRTHEPDVLVTDMMMPGMDGAELLRLVKAEFPATARIILSGHSEEEAIFRSISSAHQFLAKPCDVEVLKETISNIRTAQAGLARRDVQELIGSIDELPALPEVYGELLEASAQPTCTNKLLGEIVSKDVALTAEILHVVNSSFFALSRTIESVDHAIGLLGLDVIKGVVAQHGLFGGDNDFALDLRAIGEHSQETAAFTRLATRHTGGSMADAAEGFLAGMVHDLGLLVFSRMPDVPSATLRAVAASSDLELERTTIGIDRYAVGSYLLSLWAFSERTVEAVAHLGGPSDGPPAGPSWSLRLGHELALSHRLSISDLDQAGDDAPRLIEEIGEEVRSHGHLAPTMDAAA